MTTKHKRNYSIYLPWLLFLGIIALDQWSKYWVHNQIPLIHAFYRYPYGGIPVFENFFGVDFAIVHATNTGAAWSWMSDYPRWLLAVRVLLIGVLVAYLFSNRRPYLRIPLILVIAGALSNVIDHLIYGHVIDMLYFVFWGYSYPVFNIADSMIFIGIIWMVIAYQSHIPRITDE